jgi:hypothetical protein
MAIRTDPPIEIEILELPNGMFMWVIHHSGDLAFADGDEYSTAERAEADARKYTVANYRGVIFVTVHRTQVA